MSTFSIRILLFTLCLSINAILTAQESINLPYDSGYVKFTAMDIDRALDGSPWFTGSYSTDVQFSHLNDRGLSIRIYQARSYYAFSLAGYLSLKYDDDFINRIQHSQGDIKVFRKKALNVSNDTMFWIYNYIDPDWFEHGTTNVAARLKAFYPTSLYQQILKDIHIYLNSSFSNAKLRHGNRQPMKLPSYSPNIFISEVKKKLARM